MNSLINQAALIIEGRNTAINSKFIQSLVNQPAEVVASVIAEHDLRLGAEIRALPFDDVISSALALAIELGSVDGAHHKMWVIDQMIRILAGPERYQQIITDFCSGSDGPNTYEWDEGIAP